MFVMTKTGIKAQLGCVPQPIQVVFVPTPNLTITNEKNSKSYLKKHCIMKSSTYMWPCRNVLGL